MNLVVLRWKFGFDFLSPRSGLETQILICQHEGGCFISTLSRSFQYLDNHRAVEPLASLPDSGQRQRLCFQRRRRRSLTKALRIHSCSLRYEYQKRFLLSAVSMNVCQAFDDRDLQITSDSSNNNVAIQRSSSNVSFWLCIQHEHERHFFSH